MACNCKRVQSFEEKHGVKEYESFLAKYNRLFFRCLFFLIAILATVVIAPIVIVVAIFKMFFGEDMKLTLPKFMRKYME
jgi:lipopolysaccharide/colanic/teichoic acid biosynthesis glycosyltransferase